MGRPALPAHRGGTIFFREMHELANREIRGARESEERRRRAERCRVELLAAADGLLTELEELNVGACKRRRRPLAHARPRSSPR